MSKNLSRMAAGFTRFAAAFAVLGALAAVAMADEKPRIQGIRVATLSAQEDRVLIHLNGIYTPQTFTLEGDSLRVVCDFYDAEIDAAVKRKFKPTGGCIQTIRIGVSGSGRKRVRVVLVLYPQHEYEVDQTFYQKGNVFAITVRRDEG